MGHLKDIANQPNLQAFPGATFEIAEEVPQSQCSEAKIEGDDAITLPPDPGTLTDPGAFTGFALGGKFVTITASTGGSTGTFAIVINTNDSLVIIGNPGNGTNVVYYIHNGGSLILTRNFKSFGEFIKAAGYAYTIKGGKLYTNIPSVQLQPACTILFDPIT